MDFGFFICHLRLMEFSFPSCSWQLEPEQHWCKRQAAFYPFLFAQLSIFWWFWHVSSFPDSRVAWATYLFSIPPNLVSVPRMPLGAGGTLTINPFWTVLDFFSFGKELNFQDGLEVESLDSINCRWALGELWVGFDFSKCQNERISGNSFCFWSYFDQLLLLTLANYKQQAAIFLPLFFCTAPAYPSLHSSHLPPEKSWRSCQLLLFSEGFVFQS